MKFARKQHPTVYNRVDLCVTIHKPILLGGLVLFNDKNKNYEKIRKNTNAPLKFEIRIRIFLSWTPPLTSPAVARANNTMIIGGVNKLTWV